MVIGCNQYLTQKEQWATDIIYLNSIVPSLRSVHFIGIGGIGISGLAQWFLTKKWAVSGSDLVKSAITDRLAKRGVKVKIGHKKANLSASRQASPDLIIYSQAVKPDNPELKEAKKLGIKTLSYPQAVGLLTRQYKTIAIAGAHGKSTTTALVSLILFKAGLDPTIIIGTKLKELGNNNFRLGKSDLPAQAGYFVLEADEWKASFLNYSPAFLIITNIDREHLDFYKNLKNIKKTFLKLISQVKNSGILILNKDDKNLLSLKSGIKKISQKNNLKINWYSIKNKKDTQKIKRVIRISGEHNVSNALAALTLAKTLKIPNSKSLKAIGAYRGSWRRMEYRGKLEIGDWRLEIFDDYAHHPTEIRATLKAFREKFPQKKLICVFQPHQAKRLASLFREFQSAFDEADITLILPIYQVAGRDKINPKFTSEKLVKEIQKKQPKKLIFYLGNPANLKRALTTLLSSKPSTLSPILVMMGAGDIVKYTDSLLS